MPLIVSQGLLDRIAARSWRIHSVAPNTTLLGAPGTRWSTGIVEPPNDDPALNDLIQRAYTFLAPGGATHARLRGTFSSQGGSPTSTANVPFTFVRGAWAAGTPVFNPGGTVLIASTITRVNGSPGGATPFLEVLPASPLIIACAAGQDLQLYIQASNQDVPPDPGDNLVSDCGINAIGGGPSLVDFALDWWSGPVPGGSGGRAFGVGMAGEPGGGVW